MSAILREDPPEVSGTRPDLSPALDRIIRHCLEKEPNERFQTARDVAFALASLSGSATSTSGQVPVMPVRGPRRAWLLPAAVAIAAALGGVALGRTLAPAAPGPAFTAKTMVAQAIFNARFMPDGETLVFSSALTGTTPSLFEVRADSATPRRFGPQGTHLLSVSSTGELAVLTDATYIGHRLLSGTLARMAVDGAPRALTENVREADWLRDGSDLVVVREVPGGDQLEFPVGQIVYRTSGYLSDPRVSPDGTRVAFMEHPVKFDNRGWVRVVDRSGAVTTVGGEFNGEEGVAWSPDGRTVFFSGAFEAEYRVFAAPAAGGTPPVALVSSAGTLYIHDVAPDGRMAVTREDVRYGVVARGAGEDAERDLTPLDQAWIPFLSDDGRFVVFTDGRGGPDYAAVLRRVDGSPPVRLGDGNAWDISPDGKWVTANLFSTGRCVAYPTGAGSTVTIELGPLESCDLAVWFPDGQSLLISGREPGKPARTYRAAFPGGTPEAFLPDGVEPRHASADGRTLLVRDQSRSWHRFEIGGSSTPVKGLLANDTILDWSDDTQTVLVGGDRSIPAQVFRVRLDTGERTKVGELAPADRAGLLGVNPAAWRDDGRQYLYSYVRRVSALYLVDVAR
jgi:hypothetical protein